MRAVFTPKPKGLADLVSYAALVDEGVCLLKDGGFLAAWTYTGPTLSRPVMKNSPCSRAR